MSPIGQGSGKGRWAADEIRKLGDASALLAFSLLLAVVIGCGGKQEREAAHVERGKELFARGEFIAASVEFKNAIRVNPANVEARYHLALSQEAKREWIQAHSNLNEVLRLDRTHVGAMVLQGVLHLRENSPDQALQAADRALGMEPRNADALVIKAATVLRLGQQDRALALGERVIELDPMHINGIALTARIRSQQGAHTTAVRILETAIERMPDELALRLALARAFEQAGDLDGLVRVRRAIVEVDPRRVEHRLRLASALESIGEREEAKLCLFETLALDPKKAETRLALAALLFRFEGLDSAEALLRAGMDNTKADHALLFGLARLYEANGEPDRAQALYRQTIDLGDDDGFSMMARRMLARLLVAEDDMAESLELVEEVLVAIPTDPMALLVRAQIRLESGELDATAGDLRRVLRSWSQQFRGPIENMHSGRMLPAASEGQTSLMRLPLLRDDWRDVHTRLQTTLSRYPNSARLHNLFGELSIFFEDQDAAELAFQNALELNPSCTIAYQNLAAIRYRTGRPMEAIDALERGIKATGPATELKLQLASLYVLRGGIRRATDLYRDLLKTSPNSSVVLNNLAMLLTSDPSDTHNLDEALALASMLDLSNPLFADTLGWVHYSRGEFRQALPILERAAAEVPESAEVQFHLGMLYVQLGDLDRARHRLRLAVQGRPVYQWTNEARVVLNELAPPA